MKRYASRILKSIAVLYLLSPLTFILFVAVAFDVPAEACLRLLLGPMYYITTIGAMIAGYGLWEVRRWSWYALVAATLLLGYESAVILTELGETHHKFLAYFLTLGFLAAALYRVAREIRVPHFFPRIRWWESDPRFRLTAPATVRRADGTTLQGEVLDVAMGGCFLKLRPDLKDDESLAVEFTLYGHTIRCTGTVVWRAFSTVTNPKGVGVKFDQVHKPERRALRAIGRRLRRISSLYRRSRYLLSPDEFARAWEQLEKGPVPSPLKFRVGRSGSKT